MSTTRAVVNTNFFLFKNRSLNGPINVEPALIWVRMCVCVCDHTTKNLWMDAPEYVCFDEWDEITYV